MTDHYFVKDKHGNVGDCSCLTGSGHIDIAMHTSVKAFVNPFERFCTNNRVPDKLADQGNGFNAFNKQLKISGEITLKLMNKSVKNRLSILDLPMYVSSHALVILNQRSLCVLDNKDIHIVPLMPNTLVYDLCMALVAVIRVFQTIKSL